MSDRSTLAERFLALHKNERPLLLANAWDAGSARLFASLGFKALATTSSGYAATLGRRDYQLARGEAISHGAQLAAAAGVPVSADLEDGFGERPEDAAETVSLALEAGLAGCSIEDWDPRRGEIYEADLAAERVRAAAEAAHGGSRRLVLTARAENHLRGRDDIADTIARLQRYQEAGADVLYAPALDRREQIASLVRSVELPVNVLARPAVPPVAELAELGVARVSVGGSFAFAAYAAAASAARELLDAGTYSFCAEAAEGGRALADASL